MTKRRYRSRSKVKNAKKSSYKGLDFKSNLELHCYKKLEAAKIDVKYEEETFTIFQALVYPLACYEGTAKKLYNKGSKIRPITYTPDFVDPNGKWIIEVKGFANDVFPLKWKMFKNHLMQLGNPPVLYLPKNQGQVLQTIELIKQL